MFVLLIVFVHASNCCSIMSFIVSQNPLGIGMEIIGVFHIKQDLDKMNMSTKMYKCKLCLFTSCIDPRRTAHESIISEYYRRMDNVLRGKRTRMVGY